MAAESRAPPSPENSPSEYTPTKVRERLEYARHLGQRNLNPNPRSEVFLQLYQEAATNALEAADEEDRISYCSQLYRYDRFLQANSFVGKEPATQRKELEEKLLQLKRLEYYFRYGKYLAEELSMFEETARTVKTDNHEELQQYWRPVNEKRRAERKLFEEKRDDPIHTLIDIWNVAIEVKLETERVEWVIEQYAENNLMHYSVSELLRLGRWSQLADLLYNDAKDLAVTIPPRFGDDIEILFAVIRCIKDGFFTVDLSGDEDFPQAWRANEKAAMYRNQLRERIEGKERTKAELVEKMVKRADEAVKKREKQDMLVEKAHSSKTKTSQEFSLGQAILAKKTEDMEKAVSIQTEIELKEEKLGRLYYKRDKAIEDLETWIFKTMDD